MNPLPVSAVRWPRLELVDRRRWGKRPLYDLVDPWSYEWDYMGKTREFHVPRGFRTDLGSIVRPVWWFIAPTDIVEAALAHDLPYRYAGYVPGVFFTIEGEPSSKPWTREQADRLFGRLLRESGVPKWKRRAAYRAVRMFSGRAWERMAERGRP